MKITQLHIQNILGVDEVNLECGQITIFRGRNASKKTSILQGLQAGLGGGDLGKLARVGVADKPEVVLVLTEENGHQYRVARTGKDTVVEEQVGLSAAFEKVRRPQGFLNALFDAQLSNPLRFLAAPANTRADLLLEVLPLSLDVERFSERLGAGWRIVSDLVHACLAKRVHPLETMDAARTAIYDERTGVNRSYEDKRRSADQLQRVIPAEMPDPARDDLDRLESARDASADRLNGIRQQAEGLYHAAVAAATVEKEAETTKVKAEFKAASTEIHTAHERAVMDRLAALEREVAALRAAAQVDVEAIRATEAREVDAARAEGERRLDDITDRHQAQIRVADAARAEHLAEAFALEPAHEDLVARVARLRSEHAQMAKLLALKDQADQFSAEAESLHGMSAALTASLTALDQFKAGLLEHLPIEGLSVRGRDIYIHDVPFDQLNTAQQIKLAVQLAVLRAKGQRLPVLFVDGAERLDEDQFTVLITELQATGVQAFVSRVTSGDLAVETRAPARA